ncbi:uncharacterized protein LOC26530040 isoform X2 [Drosophila willistoni]|uniref:uncharacterized protein LOC26530040 isoform X2 n=1 Tax=Drosophila willistoni TaxID=7260 RepID=UPI000C26CF7A|nr:uncharacterized protein LOC26530040 isoform X2 [Drosophila willistoni]
MGSFRLGLQLHRVKIHIRSNNKSKLLKVSSEIRIPTIEGLVAKIESSHSTMIPYQEDNEVSRQFLVESAMYKKIRKLQKNLHKILRNQNEIFDLLNSVSKSRNRIPPAESNFFPMKKTEDLLILDKALADTNNKYISQMSKILKPVGTTSVQPLKKRFPLLFEDHLLMQLNFEGIGNKESFKQFKNINRAIFDIQQKHGYTPMEYIKEIREAFRIFQNRFLNKHTK